MTLRLISSGRLLTEKPFFLITLTALNDKSDHSSFLLVVKPLTLSSSGKYSTEEPLLDIFYPMDKLGLFLCFNYDAPYQSQVWGFWQINCFEREVWCFFILNRCDGPYLFLQWEVPFLSFTFDYLNCFEREVWIFLILNSCDAPYLFLKWEVLHRRASIRYLLPYGQIVSVCKFYLRCL